MKILKKDCEKDCYIASKKYKRGGGTWGSLKYGSQERNYLFYECSPLLGFIMSKKQERLRSELLSEDKIINLLGFFT